LVEDPDLAGDLTDWRLEEAKRRCLAADVVVEAGDWTPAAEAQAAHGGFGLLVLEGLVLRRVGAPLRYAAELMGPGDLLRPWRHDGEDATLPFDVQWRMLDRTRFAILDGAFAERAAPFPQIALALMARSMQRSRTLAINMAIVHYPDVRSRLLLMLWQLADRWGRVTPEGVRIPLRLRHHMIADLIAVRRPSATSGLQQLTREGLVQREDDGLVLRGDVLDALDDLLQEAAPARRGDAATRT
jgi:hypothetical protein